MDGTSQCAYLTCRRNPPPPTPTPSPPPPPHPPRPTPPPPTTPGPQVVLVSATLPHEVLEMTHKFMTDPVRILVKRDELTLEVRSPCGGVCTHRWGAYEARAQGGRRAHAPGARAGAGRVVHDDI